MPTTHLDRRLEALRRTIDALPIGSRLAVVREARGFRFYIDQQITRATSATAFLPNAGSVKPPIDNGEKIE